MANAKSGDTVRVHYTGRLADGHVFDSSLGGEPLEFTLGKGQIIPGFEEAVTGMSVGEHKSVEISAEKAYGPHHPELVVEVDRKQIPVGLNPRVGQTLQIAQPNGDTFNVMVVQVSPESITLDGNHPLAGQVLTFDIELVSIR